VASIVAVEYCCDAAVASATAWSIKAANSSSVISTYSAVGTGSTYSVVGTGVAAVVVGTGVAAAAAAVAVASTAALTVALMASSAISVAWIAASTVALTFGAAVGAEMPQARLAKIRVLETSIRIVVLFIVFTSCQ
jgi:hypothetical protein